MYVNGCLDPCQQFLQITETQDIRFIGPESHEHEDVTKFLKSFRTLEEVPVGAYARQKNDTPVKSFDTAVGIAVRGDMDEELVYRLTKAFWDNLEQVTSKAPWAKALDIKFAVAQRGKITLHPGALRYYREVGAIE